MSGLEKEVIHERACGMSVEEQRIVIRGMDNSILSEEVTRRLQEADLRINGVRESLLLET